jgi:hypothetical protein
MTGPRWPTRTLRPKNCPVLWVPSNQLAHSLDEFVNAVLVARKLGGEVCALGQAQTGASREQIDDLWTAGRRADNPIHLGDGISLSLDRGDDDLGILARPRKSHGDAYTPILTEMAGDLAHQEVPEQSHVLLLLVRRGDMPEAAKTEARNVVDVHQ